MIKRELSITNTTERKWLLKFHLSRLLIHQQLNSNKVQRSLMSNVSGTKLNCLNTRAPLENLVFLT